MVDIAILARKRNIAKMEFYSNAIRLRTMMTEFLLRDFGVKDRRRDLEFAKEVYDMKESDILLIESAMSSYKLKDSYIDKFPTWFIDKERDFFLDIMRDLIKNICSANTIHVTNMEEYYLRRNFQNQAICNCEDLLQEMQYVIYVFHPDVEKYMKYVELIETEIALLKGWRKSDNRIIKNLSCDNSAKDSDLKTESEVKDK